MHVLNPLALEQSLLDTSLIALAKKRFTVRQYLQLLCRMWYSTPFSFSTFGNLGLAFWCTTTNHK